MVDTLHTCLRTVFTQKKNGLRPKAGEMLELILLLSLLAGHRMHREYIRTMSKNADNALSSQEVSTLHPYFIAIFAVIYFYMLFEKMCSLYHMAFLSVKRLFHLITFIFLNLTPLNPKKLAILPNIRYNRSYIK